MNSVEEETVYGVGCAGVRMMEVGESVGGMEVCSGFPRVFADTIALPFDKIVHLAMQNLAIEDSFEVELFMIINEFGWRRGSRMTTREWIRRHEGQLDDWEDGMVATHGEGELQLVGAMTDVQCNFKGSEVSIGEFRGWSGGTNIACIQPDPITRF